MIICVHNIVITSGVVCFHGGLVCIFFYANEARVYDSIWGRRLSFYINSRIWRASRTHIWVTLWSNCPLVTIDCFDLILDWIPRTVHYLRCVIIAYKYANKISKIYVFPSIVEDKQMELFIKLNWPEFL